MDLGETGGAGGVGGRSGGRSCSQDVMYESGIEKNECQHIYVSLNHLRCQPLKRWFSICGS